MPQNERPSSGSEDERVDLERELNAALEQGTAVPWKEGLERAPAADPFRALRRDSDRERQLVGAAGFEDLEQWFKGTLAWEDQLNRSIDSPPLGVEILRLAWKRLNQQLARGLREAKRHASVFPLKGGVLSFVNGLELCVLFGYEFTGPSATTPALRVIDVWPAPRSAFDVLDDLLNRPHQTRNELKQMLQSSHRLIWHRDVMAHVDRRLEPRVFGPSIDTLHLAEILMRRYAIGVGDATAPARVLEVGTGSGFLATAALRHIPGIELVYGVEKEIEAAICTERNLRMNRPLDLSTRVVVAVSDFDAELIPSGFDLLISNPPYIPEDPRGDLDRTRDRSAAVAGVELVDPILAALPSLLAAGGEALIMVSSVTPPDYVAERLPEGFEIVGELGEDGEEVLIDVDEVLRGPDHVNLLLEGGGLWQRDHSYHHALHALTLRRKESG